MKVQRSITVTLNEQDLLEAVEDWVKKNLGEDSVPKSVGRFEVFSGQGTVGAEVTFQKPVDVVDLASKVVRLRDKG